jgi:hypothetical protein
VMDRSYLVSGPTGLRLTTVVGGSAWRRDLPS